MKFPNFEMEKVFSKEEREKIDALLEKHQPREEEKEKEMTVLSEKGKEITIKSEIATSSKELFKEHPIEMIEEASKRKFKVIGTDIESEYKDLDTAAEEEVGKLNKEEREIFKQYKEFYTIQARLKGKMPGFWYIHPLKVRDCYPGIPTDIAEVLSQPKEGEVQDID